jgi:hypothetical protein
MRCDSPSRHGHEPLHPRLEQQHGRHLRATGVGSGSHPDPIIPTKLRHSLSSRPWLMRRGRVLCTSRPLSLLLFACSGEDDDGLIELMWRNGHVVMQAQAPRKPPRPDDDEAAAAQAQAWFQYPVEERADLFSELFGEAQAAVGGARGEAARQSIRMMPPPPPPPRPAQAPREEKACPGDGGTATATDGAGSSVLTVVSSLCGSNGNHVQATAPGDVARARDVLMVTSSSTTRSRSCTTKSEQPGPGPGAARRSGKRKHNDATDAEVRTYISTWYIAPPVPARPLPGPARRLFAALRLRLRLRSMTRRNTFTAANAGRGAGVRAGAEDDDCQAAPRRASPQPLGAGN